LGGGIDIETKIVDCNSFINVRPADNNMSNEIQDPKLEKKFEDLTRYFFEELLWKINSFLGALSMDLKRVALDILEALILWQRDFLKKL